MLRQWPAATMAWGVLGRRVLRRGRTRGRSSGAPRNARARSRQRAATLVRISNAAQPVIAEACKRHGCGVPIVRGNVLAGKMSDGLTAEVVRSLDARMKSVAVALRRENTTAPVDR